MMTLTEVLDKKLIRSIERQRFGGEPRRYLTSEAGMLSVFEVHGTGRNYREELLYVGHSESEALDALVAQQAEAMEAK